MVGSCNSSSRHTWSNAQRAMCSGRRRNSHYSASCFEYSVILMEVKPCVITPSAYTAIYMNRHTVYYYYIRPSCVSRNYFYLLPSFSQLLDFIILCFLQRMLKVPMLLFNFVKILFTCSIPYTFGNMYDFAEVH